MPTVEVEILGQKYSVKGEDSEEHIKQVARFVEEKINEVYRSSPNTTQTKALILAALGIADELHKLRLEQDILASEVEKKATALAGLFD